MRLAVIVALPICLVPVLAVSAVLTCDQFETRLGQAISQFGHEVAQPGPFQLDSKVGHTGRRFDFHGIAGLSGTVTCSQSGNFEDFFVAINDDSLKAPALQPAMVRFLELAAASVCAISDGTPKACHKAVEAMVSGASRQFSDQAATGEKQPGGMREFTITADAAAEFNLTRDSISWSVGPGLAKTMPAERSPLSPNDRASD